MRIGKTFEIMAKDLTSSGVARQNILNNNYALQEIQKAVGLRGVLFGGEYKFIKKQIAAFFEVDERTISRCLQNNGDELSKNGYALIGSNELNLFKIAIIEQDVQDINVMIKVGLSDGLWQRANWI